MTVYGYIQTARGMLVDEIPYHEIDAVLSRAVDAAKDLEDGSCGDGMCWAAPLGEVIDDLKAERDRYRKALERIAGQESGGWGRIAHDALRGKS